MEICKHTRCNFKVIRGENKNISPTVIWNNRTYNILNMELHNVGAANDAGPKALSMFDLSNPDIDFCALAQGMGVESMRATTTEEFNHQFAYCMANKGPHLIEAII